MMGYKLGIEYAIKTLSHAIFSRVSVVGHARLHLVPFQCGDILAGTELHTPVGMIDKW